jgi:hypothetical protein
MVAGARQPIGPDARPQQPEGRGFESRPRYVFWRYRAVQQVGHALGHGAADLDAALELVVGDSEVEGVEHEAFGCSVGVQQALCEVGQAGEGRGKLVVGARRRRLEVTMTLNDTLEAAEQARKSRGKIKDERTKETPGTPVARTAADAAAREAGKVASSSQSVGRASSVDRATLTGVNRGT